MKLALVFSLLAFFSCKTKSSPSVDSNECLVHLDGKTYSNLVPQGKPFRNALSFQGNFVSYTNGDVQYPASSFACLRNSIKWTAADRTFEALILDSNTLKLLDETLKLEAS